MICPPPFYLLYLMFHVERWSSENIWCDQLLMQRKCIYLSMWSITKVYTARTWLPCHGYWLSCPLSRCSVNKNWIILAQNWGKEEWQMEYLRLCHFLCPKCKKKLFYLLKVSYNFQFLSSKREVLSICINSRKGQIGFCSLHYHRKTINYVRLGKRQTPEYEEDYANDKW